MKRKSGALIVQIIGNDLVLLELVAALVARIRRRSRRKAAKDRRLKKISRVLK